MCVTRDVTRRVCVDHVKLNLRNLNGTKRKTCTSRTKYFLALKTFGTPKREIKLNNEAHPPPNSMQRWRNLSKTASYVMNGVEGGRSQGI